MIDNRGIKNPNYKHGRFIQSDWKCIDCGKSVSKTSFVYGKKRCKKCYGESKKQHHYCLDCKKEISRNAIRCGSCASKLRVGKLNSNYGKHTLSNKFKGKNNPAYKHGKANDSYTYEFSIKLKRTIRERDNNICQICSKSAQEEKIQTGKNLIIHHIDYNKNNCKEDNLITVCNSCHGKTNEHRESWIVFFAELKKER